MPFECPVCQKTLQKTTYEGTNTYPCPAGCGTFLGRKNLLIIEESREESISIKSVPKSNDEIGSIKACPKCKGKMIKRHYGELSSTVIDYCASCQGIWLDPGELERIQLYYEAAHDFENDRDSKDVVPKFSCPKCSTEQDKTEECIKCGLIFSRYESRQRKTLNHQAAKSGNANQLESMYTNLMRLEVDQQYHLSEALIGFERKNRYRLTLYPADAGKGNWSIEEENVSKLSILGRNLFGLMYTFTMHMKDDMGNIVLRLHRKPRLYFHMLEAYDENGVEFGLVKRLFSFFHRVVSVTNPKGRKLLRVVGPVWSPWTFYIYDGNKRVAVVSKKWTGLLKEAYTDADKFNLEFTQPLSGSKKRLSIAALMLIDSLYFEGKKGFLNHLISAPGIQIIIAIAAAIWLSTEPQIFMDIVQR